MKSIMLLLMLAVALLPGGKIAAAQDETQQTPVEQQAMADTFQDALENNPTSKPSDWVNPDAGRSGAVVPTRTFENTEGQPCREFMSSIVIGGQEEQGYGTACRQPDGQWQLVNEDKQTSAPASAPPSQTTNYFVEPPPAYYGYPTGFFGPSRIFLSFGYVYRSGKRYRGHHYLDGRSFRQRYPLRIRNQRYVGPRIFKRYRLHDELKYRAWERRREHKSLRYKRWEKGRKDRHERRRGRRHK